MVCPVCTIAVGAGVGFLREFGVNDLITGLWFGALIVSSIMWFIDWMNRKNIHFLFRKILVIAVFYAIFIIPLYYIKLGGKVIMGDPANVMLGMDKILVGVIIGTFIFISAVVSNNYLKKINGDKAVIKYQKVLIPLVFLIIASVITFLLLGIFGA